MKHPLVRQTLREMYGREFDELYGIEDSTGEETTSPEGATSMTKNGHTVKNFFMCTTCGYRGNTSRGVKQHGKMHLSAREHFAIINATNSKPCLVYSSLTDANLVQSHTLEQAIKRTSADLEVDNNEQTATGKVRADDETVTSPAGTAAANTVQHQQPFSKKARLLEYNNRHQEPAVAGSNDEDDQQHETKIERPQTYCQKCCTQFQHVSNFLAHKKFYCKDE